MKQSLILCLLVLFAQTHAMQPQSNQETNSELSDALLRMYRISWNVRKRLHFVQKQMEFKKECLLSNEETISKVNKAYQQANENLQKFEKLHTNINAYCSTSKSSIPRAKMYESLDDVWEFIHAADDQVDIALFNILCLCRAITQQKLTAKL